MPWFLSEKVTALYVGIATVYLGAYIRLKMAQARVTIPLSQGTSQFKDRTQRLFEYLYSGDVFSFKSSYLISKNVMKLLMFELYMNMK